MIKKSTNLIIIAMVVLIILGLNIFSIYYLTNIIENDAKAINNAGIIRGSIQRITKLELNGINSDQVIRVTDKVFDNFKNHHFMIKGENHNFTTLIEKMNISWAEFKDEILSNRALRTEESRNLILMKSEIIWKDANDMVMAAQIISERKVNYFKMLFFLLLINILLIIIMIIYIKIYVKDKLEFLANHDPLTRVFNRNFLYAFLINEINRAERYSNELSVIMLDIDHFKKVNDNFGHNAGDIVLKELSYILATNVRKSDIVARFGGEEFVIVVTQTKPANVFLLAENIRTVVAKYNFKDIGKITISLGLSNYQPGDDIDSLIKRADTLLYIAKDKGRNRTEASKKYFHPK